MKSHPVFGILTWGIALGMAGIALFLGWRVLIGEPIVLHRLPSNRARSITPISRSANLTSVFESKPATDLSLTKVVGNKTASSSSIARKLELHTTVPERGVSVILEHTVNKGDSVFGIAAHNNLKPESVLWANYSQLNDNPDLISIGMVLDIPPVDGVLYEWQEGDTLQDVANRFKAKVEDVLDFPGNHFDLASQQVAPGTLVMVPGGRREYRQWIIPTIPRGAAGVLKSVYGAGVCDGGYSGIYGSGSFTWPAGNHNLSGNDYWDGHLGIDIAAGEGAPIYAADSGVVVFAGWATGGYGNTIMLDHGNGYQTLYAHLNSVNVSCGSSIGKGSIIAYAGSTGNSTGPHLHFEVRYMGGFVSPWKVLP